MRSIYLFSSISKFAVVAGLSLSLFCTAQSERSNLPSNVYSGHVVGPAGQSIAGANVQLEIGNHGSAAVTDADGGFRIPASTGGAATVRVSAAGFAPYQQTIVPSQTVELRLTLATNVQRVVVTANRTPLSIGESANAVQVLPRQALERSATITFGDRLRQVTGLQFFRRTSTMAANPTSQGVSLRGLGSTSASRTLVLANGIPVSDPFGGWIFWDQVPSLAIDDVEVVSGGVSNLYGSSAIGGVINIIERDPVATAYALDAGYGQENTPHGSILATTALGPWSGMAAADLLRTDGYIEIAPNVRGQIDTAANLHYQNGEVYLRRIFTDRAIAFLRGNVLNEARGNGTPFQRNATRLWRYSTGVDWTADNAGVFGLRMFGSQEHYRQSFSSVSADRGSESLTRLQYVSTQQLGASAQWTKVLLPAFTLVAGSDAGDVRATDYEVPRLHGNPNGLADTTARQRDVGAYAEGLLEARHWTVTASLRGDDFLNLDATQHLQTGLGPITTVQIPDRSETLLSPKVGVVRRLNKDFSVSASGYRAFRSPTLNELYRQSQVGQELTLANPALQSERATGWETGTEFTLPSRNTAIRASYFWTEVNRPVTALTLSVTPTKVLKQRENLGQIRSRGVALAYQTSPLSWLSITGGYQYANATVTRYSANPGLIGKWIPQVPHNMATMQVRATKQRLGVAGLLGTVSGRQFDDDANTFLLHGYFQLDGYVSHELNSRVEFYGAMNNIFDRSIEVGRTPILTLGTPRMASFGIRIHSPDSASQ